jgi:hypothetical protein
MPKGEPGRSGNASPEPLDIPSFPADAGGRDNAISRPQPGQCVFFYRCCLKECSTCSVMKQNAIKASLLPQLSGWHGYCECCTAQAGSRPYQAGNLRAAHRVLRRLRQPLSKTTLEIIE